MLKWILAFLLAASTAHASADLESANTEYLSHATAICSSYPFSMSIWIKLDDATTNDHSAMWIGDNSTVNNYLGGLYQRGSAGSDPYGLHVRDSTTNEQVQAGTAPSTTWVHIGGVFTSTTSRTLYPNGGTKVPSSEPVSPTGADATSIGLINSSNPSWPMDGKVAEPALWCGTSLSDSNMTDLFNGANPQAIAGLTNYWTLLTDATATVGGLNLTENGTITFDSGDHPTIDAYSQGPGIGIWLLSR